MLAIFIDFYHFLDILTFPFYKETYDVSSQQMMSAIFYFQHTLIRLLNNRSNCPHPYPKEKTTLKKPSLIKVNYFENC